MNFKIGDFFEKDFKTNSPLSWFNEVIPYLMTQHSSSTLLHEEWLVFVIQFMYEYLQNRSREHTLSIVPL